MLQQKAEHFVSLLKISKESFSANNGYKISKEKIKLYFIEFTASETQWTLMYAKSSSVLFYHLLRNILLAICTKRVRRHFFQVFTE